MATTLSRGEGRDTEVSALDTRVPCQLGYLYSEGNC